MHVTLVPVLWKWFDTALPRLTPNARLPFRLNYSTNYSSNSTTILDARAIPRNAHSKWNYLWSLSWKNGFEFTSGILLKQNPLEERKVLAHEIPIISDAYRSWTTHNLIQCSIALTFSGLFIWILYSVGQRWLTRFVAMLTAKIHFPVTHTHFLYYLCTK